MFGDQQRGELIVTLLNNGFVFLYSILYVLPIGSLMF